MELKESDQKKILFQKLGNIWYAFVEIDGEKVFYTRIPMVLIPKLINTKFMRLLKQE